MKKILPILAATSILILLLSTCKKDELNITFTDGEDITDIEGNVYKTVKIGTQTWMKENLKTTKYRNGNDIINITDSTEWNKLTRGAFCWYNNNATYKNTYGALYNFYAVVDNRSLCPTGWHVPSDSEWNTLERYIGIPRNQANITGKRGTDQAKMLMSTIGWENNNNGTNLAGFTALPGGSRIQFLNYDFEGVGRVASFWGATEADDNNECAWTRIFFLEGEYGRSNPYKLNGSSVRCIKD